MILQVFHLVHELKIPFAYLQLPVTALIIFNLINQVNRKLSRCRFRNKNNVCIPFYYLVPSGS